MAALGRLWYKAWIDVPSDPTIRFDGKTVIVTGANTGIGLEAAIKFVQLGAEKVIISVRTPQKGHAAKETIERRAKRTGIVEVALLELADYSSLERFVDRVKQLERVDAVILNAGVQSMKWSASQYGWLSTFQVNTISTVYLALLLLPYLEATAAKTGVAHLEFVGSGLYQSVSIDPRHRAEANVLQSYNNEEDFHARRCYALSKLALHCAAQVIALKLGDESQVIVTDVSPGFVATDLAREYSTSFALRTAMYVLRFFQRTPEQGARSLVSGILVGSKAHGRLWQHDQVQVEIGVLAEQNADELRQQLWHDVLSMLQRDVPNIQRLANIRSGQ